MIKLYLTVFFGRLFDVTLSTIRINTSIKGKIKLSFFLGFFEALLYFIVVRNALLKSTNIYNIAICYALGYAFGILIGTYLSHYLFNDEIIIQVVLKDDKNIIENLREKGIIVTIIKLNNSYDQIKKNYILIQTKRKMLKELSSVIYNLDNSAFILVNETKRLSNSFI